MAAPRTRWQPDDLCMVYLANVRWPAVVRRIADGRSAFDDSALVVVNIDGWDSAELTVPATQLSPRET